MGDNRTGHVRTIPSVFRESVQKYGKLPAVTDVKGFYTYELLDQLSDNVAFCIISKGIQHDSTVAILMERSRQSIAVILGVLKAGCRYMFMDKQYPKQRIEFMLQDAEARLIIHDGGIECPEGYSGILVVDSEALAKREQNEGIEIPVNLQQTGEKGAYIIYTSGSTGLPKGLMINHNNFMSLYDAWGKDHFQPDNREGFHIAVIAPFVFDMCVLMIFTSLFMGYNLHIIPDDVKHSGKGIITFLNDYRIGLMDVTPNYLRLMDNYLTLNPQESLNIRRIFSIGDVLSPNLAKSIIRHAVHKDFELYNTYGPAECTVLMTWHIIDRDHMEELELVPIGRLTDNASAAVVDEDMNEQTPGQIGELVIFGDCVGMGYISKREINPNPFGVAVSGRHGKSYRTGDLVKLNHAGEYEFIGRVDRQCKINGYRVEVEEIEHAIEKISGVDEARVVVRKDADGFSRLYAFYTGGKQLQNRDIRSDLKECLPHYMVPQNVLFCENFPITHNGKIDYETLIQKSNSRNSIQENEIGKYAIKTAAHFLGKRSLDTSQSFFGLGGDSITLLALVSSITSDFHVDVDISRLYLCSSLEQMADYLRGLKFQSVSGEPKEKMEFRKELPMIEPQKKLYHLERKALRSKNPGAMKTFSLLYKIVFSEPIDSERLERAVNHVMDANEIFYVSLENVRKRSICKMHGELAKISIKQGKAESEALDEICYFPPGGRQFIEMVQYGENVVYLNVKHLFLDFISVQYFLDDVMILYRGDGEPSKRLGFMSYLNRNNFEEERNMTYWKQKLDQSAKRTRLLSEQTGRTGYHILRIRCEQEVYRSLKARAVQKSTSQFIILLSDFLQSVSAFSGENCMRIGCYCPGRNYRYDNGVLGMFTNVLPLICDVPSHHGVERVKKEFLEMIQHQNISQSRLYQMVSLDEIADGELFDICFNYQNDWICMDHINSGIERIETINLNPDVTGRNFYFGVIEENGEMIWEIRYNQALYSETLIRSFIQHLKEEAGGICEIAM